MKRKPVVTNWKDGFDDKPTTTVPRIQFCHKFNKKYLNKTARILEIGCGTGTNIYLIDGDNTIGVDIQFNALATAKKFCKRSDFVVASAFDLPFKDEIFDSICIWGLLEELTMGTEIKAIKEANRIMHNDANLMLSAYNKSAMSKLFDPAVLLYGLRQYDFRNLSDILNKNGFSVIEHIIKGGWNTLLANNTFLIYKHLFHKKEGKLKRYFDQKSNQEFNSVGSGKLYTFVVAKKVPRIK